MTENLEFTAPETEPVKPAQKTVDFVRYLFNNYGKEFTADQIIKKVAGLDRVDVYRISAELAATGHTVRELKASGSDGKRFVFRIKADDETHADALYEAYELGNG